VERVRTSELAQHAGERVSLRGWLHHRRLLSQVAFFVLRDAWGTARSCPHPMHPASTRPRPSRPSRSMALPLLTVELLAELKYARRLSASCLLRLRVFRSTCSGRR